MNKTINQLEEKTTGSNNDELLIWDSSTAKTKKISILNLLKNLVAKTTTVNGHPLSNNVEVTKDDVGLGNVYETDSFPCSRWLRFSISDKKSLVIKAGVTIKVGSHFFHIDSDTTYSMGSSLTAGADYFVYLNYSDDSWTVTCSITKSADTDSKRYIGRFHTLCVSVGSGTTMIAPTEPSSSGASGNYLIKSYDEYTDPDFYTFYNKAITARVNQTYYDVVTVAHPLAGYSAGDILPESVWCLTWKPSSRYEDAMVYDRDTDIAVDVYLQSGKGLSTRSKYSTNTRPTNSRQQYNHQADMMSVGKRLLRDFEFSSCALGSNERTNIAGSSSVNSSGGHSDTASRRMISAIGCEDCCGFLLQWLDEIIGKSDETSWSEEVSTTFDGHASFGQINWNPRALMAGGAWYFGAYCGSRCRHAAAVRSDVDTRFGGRGSSHVIRK